MQSETQAKGMSCQNDSLKPRPSLLLSQLDVSYVDLLLFCSRDGTSKEKKISDSPAQREYPGRAGIRLVGIASPSG